jgi:hypothetical protein
VSIRVVTMGLPGGCLVIPKPRRETATGLPPFEWSDEPGVPAMRVPTYDEVTLRVVDLHLVEGRTHMHVRAAFDLEAMTLYADATEPFVRDLVARLEEDPLRWERYQR